MSSSSGSPFPEIRRVVTGHTTAGKAIFLRDETLEPHLGTHGGVNAVYDVYRTSEHPALLGQEVNGVWIDEIKVQPELVSSNGSTLRTADFAPGANIKFHRTLTIDYGIVAKGSIVVELDDGECRVLQEGDIIVQRGTIHAWKNKSSQWARVHFILLAARPIEVNGEQIIPALVD